MKTNLIAWSTIASVALLSCKGPIPEEGGAIETAIEFIQSEVVIPVGESSLVELSVTPADKISDVEVQVSDVSIAEIDNITESESSVILSLKSKGLGSTTLLAVCDEAVAKCAVRVDPIDVQSLSLDKTSITIPVFGTHTLSVKISPDNATNPTVIWSSDNEEVAKVAGGIVTALAPGNARITAKASSCEAVCDVEVVAIDAESLTFDATSKNLSVQESFIVNAVILPENTTYKDLEWSLSEDGIVSYELIDAVEDDNILSAKITALQPGEVTVTATIDGISASCDIVVNAVEVPLADPKIGDYFYSDGTWSDGGLISINKDGTKPVWADVKPAPLPDKTVIGIVFSTNPERLSHYETDNGFTKGLVMCTKLAHGPDTKLTRYSLDVVSCIGNHKLGTSWYADLFGYHWTQTILQNYMGENIQQCPAFDWTTTDFNPAAPANTSDWFVPSIGQLWDMLANLAGEEVAKHLKDLRSYEYDITYGMDTRLTYNPIEQLNSCMALVPENDKEEFPVSRNYGDYDVCELLSSSIYDNSDGVCCIFWLGTNGDFEPLCAYCDDNLVCRPILAF